jgi:hypothetical protein
MIVQIQELESISCYAAKFDNHDLLELCGAGILPARIIQTKCTTAYKETYNLDALMLDS